MGREQHKSSTFLHQQYRYNASGTQSHSLASYIRENIPQIRNYMTSPRSVVIVSFCICEIDSCKHIFGYCYFIRILCFMLR